MPKAIINVNIYDFENYRENAYVLYDESIIEVGNMADFNPEKHTIIDGEGRLLMPGLVCGHTHIYSTFARGMSVPFAPNNFQDILDQLWWKLDRHLSLDAVTQSGIVSAVDFAKNGVTTLIDHHASGAIKGSLESLRKAVCDRVGLRAVLAFETSDRFNVTEAIAENRDFLNRAPSPFTSALFGLHASLSLSEATLGAVKTALKDAPIHIHVAESNLDQTDALAKYGERVVIRLDRHRLLNPDSILTHAIHVDEDELDLIKRNDCVIAVNVTSNMNNGVGLPDIAAFIRKGIPVIAGNDGLSTGMTNEYLNLLYTMHHKAGTPITFSLDDLLSIIHDTYTYASRQLGIRLGKIKPGYAADFLAVPYVAPTPIDDNNAFGHMFYGLFHSFKPDHVFVAGRQIVKHRHVSPALTDLYASSKNVALQVWTSIQKEGESR